MKRKEGFHNKFLFIATLKPYVDCMSVRFGPTTTLRIYQFH